MIPSGSMIFGLIYPEKILYLWIAGTVVLGVFLGVSLGNILARIRPWK